MATKNTPVADAARGITSAKKPARASKAVLKVDAKRPSTKAAKARLDPQLSAAKGVPTATSKRGFAAATVEKKLPIHEVKTLGQLRMILADFPTSNTFTTDRKFGKDIITVSNIRGRAVAEIHSAPKK